MKVGSLKEKIEHSQEVTEEKSNLLNRYKSDLSKSQNELLSVKEAKLKDQSTAV
jgi:hypothetical protein